MRPSSLSRLCWLGTAALLCGCDAFKVDVGTKDPIKLDPIDINIRMDVYQHSSDKVGEGKKDEDEAKAARERLYNRQQQVQEMKNNRWVVETHRGELQIREKPAGDNGAWVEKTVKEENEDRKLLMRLKAKELNLDLHVIQEEFWKDNVEKAYQGEWIETVDPSRPGMFKQIQKESRPAASGQ
ncbi:MAG: DUF1318 domain-containing protein [Verrucomicrobiales bacterium]|nr:DUF1318 domain-containing protein [Verrucomicrobiales bacterium]